MITITILMVFVLSEFCVASGVNNQRKFRWTPELDAIVIEIFHKTESKEGNHKNNMKETWDRLLPQYNALSARTLRQHALNLLYKGGEKGRRRINWTPELASDLIEMYRRIVKSSEKSPTYKLHDEFYMKHANITRLAPAVLWNWAKFAGNKSGAKKIESLKLPSRDVGARRNKPCNTDKGKEIMEASAERPTAMSPRQQDWHPQKFYDFMSVNESHRESLRVLNGDMQDSYVASSGQTLCDNPNAVPNFQNIHYGESSNTTSLQQSDSASGSTSWNQPKQFFNFF